MTFASDRSDIDYAAEQVGVPVRKNLCRPIIFQHGFGESSSDSPVVKPKWRGLLTGEIEFGNAVSTERQEV